MKLQIPSSGSSRAGSPGSHTGFTLTELLIAIMVFMLMLVGIISANLFGLRMFQVNATKLSATEWSRNAFGKISDEIHVCNSLVILNVDTNGNFVGLLDGEKQQGNALQINPTEDTNNFIIYFVNTSDQTFRRTLQQTNTVVTNATVILADSVTNKVIFSAQDLSGNVLTNRQDSRMIHVVLEFHQPERFMQGPDYYKLETSVTRRALQ